LGIFNQKSTHRGRSWQSKTPRGNTRSRRWAVEPGLEIVEAIAGVPSEKVALLIEGMVGAGEELYDQKASNCQAL
jgi:hypothetical protein